MLTVSLWIATGLLAVAALLGLVRVVTARDAASRALVGDLVFFSGVGILAIQGYLNRSAVTIDLVLIAAVIGILSTIALSRILTRGRR